MIAQTQSPLNSNNRVFFKSGWVFASAWALLSGVVVYIQSFRWVPLGDYANMVEYAYKIFCGALPFRDFMTPYPPGTFYIMSWLMKLFGVSNMVFKIYVVFLQVLIVLLTYAILQKLNRDRSLNLILILPLAFVGHAMFPFPVYDIHAHLFVLVAIGLFIAIMNREIKSSPALFLYGVLVALPMFFKQNVGVGMIVAAYLGLLILLFMATKPLRLADFMTVLSGSVLVFAFALFLLYKNDLLVKAYHDIFSFPALNRNPLQSLYEIALNFLSAKFLVLYASFFLTIVAVNKIKKRKLLTISGDAINLALLVSFFAVPVSLFLVMFLKFRLAGMAANAFAIVSKVYRYFGGLWYLVFLILVVLLLLKIKRRGIRALDYLDVLSVQIMIISLFQFLAQKLLSAASIWPLLLILLCYIRREVTAAFNFDLLPQIRLFILLLVPVCAFWLFASNSAWYQNHLSFNFKPPRSSTENLKGLACEGDVIPIMDSMFRFVEKEIPFNESIATLPGEDPFYFTSGRKSLMSYLHLIDHTYNYDAERVWQEMKEKNIGWIIVKTETQVKVYTNTEALLKHIMNECDLYAQIRGYEIYKRRKR
jgi:hypothetical protein